MFQTLRQKGAKRLVVAVLGVVLVLTGVSALSAGRPAYRNYKGQWVFPPVAIVMGLGALVLALWAPRPQSRRKRKPGGR
jgi:hypothetical protein